MDQMVLKKDELPGFLCAVRKSYELYGPTQKGDDIVLGPVSDAKAVTLDYRNFTFSPKDFFFPQCEEVCRYRGTEMIPPPEASGPRAIFGIRPCDARSFAMLDKVFSWEELGDPYYLKKRENHVVISVACLDPALSCFCTAVGGAPDDEAGSDVTMFDLGDSYLVKAVTERGEKLLGSGKDVLTAASDDDVKKRNNLAEDSRGKVPSELPSFDQAAIKEKLDGSFYDEEYWDAMALRCLGCGACAYLCPTCHCFDITDEDFKEEGRRIRTWDCCMYPHFTAHASGHNPRPTQRERSRQRVMHKFSYCVENFGEAYCVGCGRCVVCCPVNIDVREVLRK